MKRAKLVSTGVVVVVASLLVAWLARPAVVHAHCDALDGPVVTEARTALQQGDITPVLKWIKPEYESEARDVFRQALAVRDVGPEARQLADRLFYETVVRLHRAGEGAPFVGLQTAGRVTPSVTAADRAITEGSVNELAVEIGRAAERGVRERFARVAESRKKRDDSVAAGREYVEAYVQFVHYVEALHGLIAGGGGHESGSAHDH